MKFILIIFIYALTPDGGVSVMHKAFPSKEACETAKLEAREKMPLPANSSAAAICISEKDLIEFELT